MSRERKAVDDSKPKVPDYIVTFSDMVTLLLTFFVLLVSFAETQSQEKFERGQMSFEEAIAGFGLRGFLFSNDSKPQFQHPKVKYNAQQGQDQTENRSIDADREILRRIIMELKEKINVRQSEIKASSSDFMVTDIKFSPDEAGLDEQARAFLQDYCRGLRENFPVEKPILYVVGIASELSDPKAQWITSANRAQVTSDFIRIQLPGWRVYNWGAGAGGQWCGRTGVITGKTKILIATLTQ